MRSRRQIRPFPPALAGWPIRAAGAIRDAAKAPALFFLLAAMRVVLAAQVPPAPAAPAARFVVVIDAAHGGDDGGARFGNQQEKAYTLALSVRLRSLLVARGFAVVTTRESDATVDADRRVEIANRANAQACLSLHAAESGEGVHLFMSSLAPAQASRFHAWKTAQAPWIMRSVALAGDVNAALKNSGLTVTLGRTALPVIDSLSCPAVAVEVAPQRPASGDANAQGAPATDDPSYMAQVAEALAAALVEWRADGMGGRHP
jgi:N-acetylmuramoyl-L-alanine amidase